MAHIYSLMMTNKHLCLSFTDFFMQTQRAVHLVENAGFGKVLYVGLDTDRYSVNVCKCE